MNHGESVQLGLSAARSDTRAVVLYDGKCNVCNAGVRFALYRTGPFEAKRVLFASLQGEVARHLLGELAPRGTYAAGFYPGTGVPNTSYVLTGGAVHAKTDGSIALLALMGAGWPLLGWLLSLLPRAARDWGYDQFAAQRFRLFGGTDAVQPYPPAASGLFLDSIRLKS